jgi:hypothetical protein
MVRYVDSLTSTRTIPVGDAQTIVVRPRIPDWVKWLLGLSLALNAVVLVLLLTVGLQQRRWARALESELAAITLLNPSGAQLNPKGAAPEEVVGSAVDTVRHTVNETLGAVQEMEAATIRAEIPVNHQLPLQMNLPIDQNTTVTTVAAVPLQVPALITLPGGGGYVNATVALDLPAGTQLPIHLGMTVPVSASVPVQMSVPVNIPLRETELGGPIARLRRLLEPAARALSEQQK